MHTTDDLITTKTEIPEIVQSRANAAFLSIKLEVAEMRDGQTKSNKNDRSFARRVWRRIGAGVAAAIAFIVLGITTLGIVSPALAAKIPLLGSIFEQTGSNLTYSGNYSDKAQVLTEENESGMPNTLTYMAEDQGYKVTASEVYSDGYSIYLTIQVESEERDFTYMAEHYTDGSNMEATAATVYSPFTWEVTDADGNVIENGKDLNGRLEGKTVDEHTYIGMLKLDLPTQYDNAFLNIDIYRMGYDDSRPEYQRVDSEAPYFADGNWEFTVPVQADPDVRTITVDEPGGDYMLHNVVISDYQIVVETILPDDESQHFSCDTIVLDQDGNILRTTTSEVDGIARFPVKGKELTRLHIFIFDDYDEWFGAYKANDPDAWENAIIEKEILLE